MIMNEFTSHDFPLSSSRGGQSLPMSLRCYDTLLSLFLMRETGVVSFSASLRFVGVAVDESEDLEAAGESQNRKLISAARVGASTSPIMTSAIAF